MALGTNVKRKSDDEQVVSNETTATEKEVSTVEESEIEEIADEENKEKVLQYCVFNAGEEEYAIPIDIVKEVVKYSNPSPIPQMPQYIIGMSNVRGNIYGVMDLQIFFQGDNKDDEHKYLLVIDHETYKMAIRINEVPNSLMVLESEIEELNSATLKSVIGQKYLKGIIKRENRMIILFDILGMISGDQFTEIK